MDEQITLRFTSLHPNQVQPLVMSLAMQWMETKIQWSLDALTQMALAQPTPGGEWILDKWSLCLNCSLSTEETAAEAD